jgi:hypothetical protein
VIERISVSDLIPQIEANADHLQIPPGASHRSRATNTESSIASKRRKYPIHSEMIMSTSGTGSVISSILPCNKLAKRY